MKLPLQTLSRKLRATKSCAVLWRWTCTVEFGFFGDLAFWRKLDENGIFPKKSIKKFFSPNFRNSPKFSWKFEIFAPADALSDTWEGGRHQTRLRFVVRELSQCILVDFDMWFWSRKHSGRLWLAIHVGGRGLTNGVRARKPRFVSKKNLYAVFTFVSASESRSGWRQPKSMP